MSSATSPAVVLRGQRSHPAVEAAELGMWFFLATVTMLFAAFASSYLIRRTSSDWTPIAMPTLLWLNTFVLLISSVTLERVRACLSEPSRRGAAWWLNGTIALGLAFVAGQIVVWRSLVAQGIFLPTSPHASFFYLLTGLHAVHVTAGLILLLALRFRVGDASGDTRTATRQIRIVASYWHYMSSLWIFLFLLLALL